MSNPKLVYILIFTVVLISYFFCHNILSKDNGIDNNTLEIHSGYVLPSKGKLNLLLIYAQFKDDNYKPNYERWVKGTNPKGMNTWIDSNWTENPTKGSLTHYFNDMSLMEFKVTGISVSVITKYDRQHYLDLKQKRYHIQKEIIQSLDDSLDFSEFDNWDLIDYNNHKNTPDGIVDLIIFIWRNNEMDYPDSIQSSIRARLDFTNDQADLGFQSEYFVDNGERRIKTGFYPNSKKGQKEPGGSGLTIRNFISYGEKRIFQIMIHEIGHFLLGTNDEHTGLGFWGTMAHWGMKSFVTNSFEREKLDWGDPYLINNNPNGTFNDFYLPEIITSGKYIKFIIDDKRNEYFFLENHQGNSYWETNFENSTIEPGIYVIRSDGKHGENVHLIPADGRHKLRVKQMVDNPWGDGELPVFYNAGPDRINGTHDCERQAIIWNDKKLNPQVIHFTEDPFTGKPVLDVRHKGDNKDAFRLGYNELFSPYSNPNSQDKRKDNTPFGFQIKDFADGTYLLDVFVNTSLNGPPSKPQGLDIYKNDRNEFVLTWLPNIEPDVTSGGYYKIYISKTSTDQNAFELLETIPSLVDGKHNITRTYENNYRSKRVDSPFYKITAVDNSLKESVYSDTVYTNFSNR